MAGMIDGEAPIVTVTCVGDEATQKIKVALNECDPDRRALAAELNDLIRRVQATALEELEIAYGNNRQAFAAARKRVNDAAGTQSRTMLTVLWNYAIRQYFVRTVVKTMTAKTQGPWRLPAGVRHPSERSVTQPA